MQPQTEQTSQYSFYFLVGQGCILKKSKKSSFFNLIELKKTSKIVFRALLTSEKKLTLDMNNLRRFWQIILKSNYRFLCTNIPPKLEKVVIAGAGMLNLN